MVSSPVLKSVIETLAENGNTTAGSYSRAVLSLVDSIDYPIIIELPDEDEGSKNAGIPPSVDNTELLKAYPNPANDYFIFEYRFAKVENTKDCKIALFNNAGTEIKDFKLTQAENHIVFECAGLEEGIYFLRKYKKKPLVEEIRVEISRMSVDVSRLASRYVSDNTC